MNTVQFRSPPDRVELPRPRKNLPYFGLAALLCGLVATLYIVQPGAITRLGELPAQVLLLAATATSVSLVCAGQMYVHRRFNHRDFVQHNEVAGFIISVAGTLYSVVLGFLTLVAWQHYTDARQLVALESAAATDAWHVALDLPAVRRTRIRQDILEYSNRMVHDEWPQMRRGGKDLRSALIIMDAIAAVEDFKPADLGEGNAQLATLQQLGVMHDDQLRRLADNESGVSWFEWVVLLIGAVCLVGFCWLFGMANRRVHLLMTSAVTIIIAAMLVLLFELQFPFRTSLAISSSDWSAVIEHIQLMQHDGQAGMRM